MVSIRPELKRGLPHGESTPYPSDISEDESVVQIASSVIPSLNAPHANESGDPALITGRPNANTNEIIELTSSEDEALAHKGAKQIVNQRSRRVVIDQDPNSSPQRSHNISDVTRQTRSSSGIAKKHMLKDAALVSSDEDLPTTISPPKRTRVSLTKGKPAAYHNITETGNVLPCETQAGLSLSPLKLEVTQTTDAVPIHKLDAPFVIDSPAKDKTKTKVKGKGRGKGKGKEKAKVKEEEVDIPFFDISSEQTDHPTTLDSDEAMHLQEEANMAIAIHASRNMGRENHAGGTSASASSVPNAYQTENDTPVKVKTEVENGRLHPDEIFYISRAMRETQSSIAVEHGNDFHEPHTPIKKGLAHIMNAVEDGPQLNVNIARKLFKDVISPPQTTPMLGTGPVLGDYMKFCVFSQDDFLKEDYPGLPNLRLGTLRNWNLPGSDAGGSHAVWFSEWAMQCPNMDFETALAALRFICRMNLLNASRVSPLDVYIQYTTEDKKRAILHCNNKVAICLTPILSKECHLYEPVTTGLRNKFISGYMHHQEYQRMASFACMVFDKKYMVAQMKDGVISFTTMGNFKGDRETASPSKPPCNPGIISDSYTPGPSSKKKKTLKADTFFKSVLNYSDEVPVYDAREIPFNFDTDLDDISAHLPLLGEEIPANSFVVVGYTMGYYEKESRPHLTTNVLFAILVGTEYDD